jgi:hypothetical protein
VGNTVRVRDNTQYFPPCGYSISRSSAAKNNFDGLNNVFWQWDFILLTSSSSSTITTTSPTTESPHFQPFAIYDLMETPGMTLSDDFEV